MSMVSTEYLGKIAILTLNNPAKYNALGENMTMLEDLFNAMTAAVARSEMRAIVLTGAGKGFCSGAQFGGDTFERGASIGSRMRDALNPLIEKMRSLRVPIVVAVNGPAAGAGVGIALAGDIVIAARSARFVLSFVRLGAVLDAGTSVFVQRSIGSARARALALLGEPLDAEMAAEWGLIWKVVDDGVLRNEAIAIAHKLADGPPFAIDFIKGQIDAGWNDELSSALDREAALQSHAFATSDLREGASAYMEKRPPCFRGQ